MISVIVQYDQLSPEELNGVIEKFVTRDGTDYGEHEISLKNKINQVLSQLRPRKTVLALNKETETCNILRSDDSALKNLDN